MLLENDPGCMGNGAQRMFGAEKLNKRSLCVKIWAAATRSWSGEKDQVCDARSGQVLWQVIEPKWTTGTTFYKQ